MTVSPRTSEAVPPELWQFPVEDGLIVARPEISGLFCLNATARVIWEAFRETGTETVCAAVVRDVFGVPQDVARRDVQAAVEGWRRSGLLGIAPVQAVKATGEWRRALPMHIADCRIGEQVFRLVTDSEEATAEIGPRLESIRVTGHEAGVVLGIARVPCGFALVRDGEIVAEDESVAGCRTLLFQEMVRLAIPGREWLALLHAGACGRDGRCVILPAESFSGKTTLAAALMRDGLFAYTDDFAGVEAGSFGVPVMPFGMAVREGSWPLVAESFPELWNGEVHMRFGTPVRFLSPRLPEPASPGQTAAMVFSRWERGAKGEPQELDLLETVIRLNACGFWVAHSPGSIAAFLGWLAGLRRYSVCYGATPQIVPFIRELIVSADERANQHLT